MSDRIEQQLESKKSELRLNIEKALLMYLAQELLFSKMSAKELKEKYIEEQSSESRLFDSATRLIDEIGYILTDNS